MNSKFARKKSQNRNHSPYQRLTFYLSRSIDGVEHAMTYFYCMITPKMPYFIEENFSEDIYYVMKQKKKTKPIKTTNSLNSKGMKNK